MESEPTSQSLAAIVVAYRILGICKDEAKSSMIELMKRKENGDEFDFELYISEKLAQIPKSELNPTIIQTLSTISSVGTLKG
jgi:hypothetical protein